MAVYQVILQCVYITVCCQKQWWMVDSRGGQITYVYLNTDNWCSNIFWAIIKDDSIWGGGGGGGRCVCVCVCYKEI